VVEYYNHPSGSGAIPEMTATYPNSGKDWNNSICAYQSTKVPQLEWTVDRNDSIIYQQCAFFNGVALDAATGLDKDISSGKSNVDGTDCSGTGAAAPECSFEFQLPSGYQVKSYYEKIFLTKVKVPQTKVTPKQSEKSASLKTIFLFLTKWQVGRRI